LNRSHLPQRDCEKTKETIKITALSLGSQASLIFEWENVVGAFTPRRFGDAMFLLLKAQQIKQRAICY
jgi:hypothetical protein